MAHTDGDYEKLLCAFRVPPSGAPEFLSTAHVHGKKMGTFDYRVIIGRVKDGINDGDKRVILVSLG